MIERRSYIAESIISPGCAVVQGSAENKVAAPGAGGAGAFVGVYPFEDNQAATPDSPIGIAVAGIVLVLAGGTVTAGNRSALKSDRSGSFVNVASTAGQHPTCGTFLQSGVAGEYVDMIVERGTVTITTGGTGGGGGAFTETDPTVPAWAKAANKPTYTAAEVGAYTTTETDEKIEEIEATFRGNFANWGALLAYSGDKDKNDRAVVQNMSDYLPAGKIGTWKAKYNGTDWLPEYQINEEPLTTAQLAALNSGITAAELSVMLAGIINAQNTANAAEAALLLMVQAGEDALPPNPIPQGGIYIQYEEVL
ncbi:hypothetical protein FACS1894147_02390 [Spirochaetia bacterium]|nr:hypothetical protein FACS1894147_02390 [Spirochaetia bacterium]